MGILGRIARLDSISRRIVGELNCYHNGEKLSERVLVLRCDFNDAICDLYAFAESHRDSFDGEMAVSAYCRAVDTIRNHFACASTRWMEKVKHVDSVERQAWTKSLEDGLDRCIRDIRRTLNTEQLALSLNGIKPCRSAKRFVD